ncbi:MAG: intradiol ring-cleavage dioxygenase [Rhodospirillales bacterium]|nr:intradiol ring-cleavage dioxygenase [Rhodospirillales bacterium]
MSERPIASRRGFLAASAGFVTIWAGTPAWAAKLIVTPRQSEGPFYPVQIPLDSDNDLVTVAGRPARAAGEIAHVFGRVIDDAGRPVRGAQVEIWQCDAFGQYHHPRDRGGNADPNFQGYGRMAAAEDGGYRFRTIRPVAYPGRAPHIHFAITGPGIARLTTQMYVAGEPLNDRDFLLNNVRDSAARASLVVALEPAPTVEAGARAGTFDIVLGHNTARE